MKKEKSNLSLGIIVGLVVIVGGYYVWKQYNTPKISPAAQVQADQVKQLLANVSKLILTPKEDPIIATINDAAGLAKTQPFYTGAKNGDIVLVYQKAAKVIVYSPDRNLIINVGPIIPQPLQQTATTTKK